MQKRTCDNNCTKFIYFLSYVHALSTTFSFHYIQFLWLKVLLEKELYLRKIRCKNVELTETVVRLQLVVLLFILAPTFIRTIVKEVVRLFSFELEAKTIPNNTIKLTVI